jgi:hypothetical protein
MPTNVTVAKEEQTDEKPKRQPVTHSAAFPSLHIDVQIHIASDASADQIDKIFESMAKHFQTAKVNTPE